MRGTYGGLRAAYQCAIPLVSGMDAVRSCQNGRPVQTPDKIPPHLPQAVNCKLCKQKKTSLRPPLCRFPLYGGGKGSRTPDLLNAIQTLYQLSYTPEKECAYDSTSQDRTQVFFLNIVEMAVQCRRSWRAKSPKHNSNFGDVPNGVRAGGMKVRLRGKRILRHPGEVPGRDKCCKMQFFCYTL